MEIPAEAAEQMTGEKPLFAYDIRLIVDGQVWQPEDHGADVQISVKNVNEDLPAEAIEIIHVKTDLMENDGSLSGEAVENAVHGLSEGNVAAERIDTDVTGSVVSFETSSFSGFLGNALTKLETMFGDAMKNRASDAKKVQLSLEKDTAYEGDATFSSVGYDDLPEDFEVELIAEDAGEDHLQSEGTTTVAGNINIKGINVRMIGVTVAAGKTVSVQDAKLTYYGTKENDDLIVSVSGDKGEADIHTLANKGSGHENISGGFTAVTVALQDVQAKVSGDVYAGNVYFPADGQASAEEIEEDIPTGAAKSGASDALKSGSVQVLSSAVENVKNQAVSASSDKKAEESGDNYSAADLLSPLKDSLVTKIKDLLKNDESQERVGSALNQLPVDNGASEDEADEDKHGLFDEKEKNGPVDLDDMLGAVQGGTDEKNNSDKKSKTQIMGAVAVTVGENSSQAIIDTGANVNAGWTTEVKSTMKTDAYTFGDGRAAAAGDDTDVKTALGAGVAVAVVDGEGRADVKGMVLSKDKISVTSASSGTVKTEARAGFSKGDIGIGGAVAVQVGSMDSKALMHGTADIQTDSRLVLDAGSDITFSVNADSSGKTGKSVGVGAGIAVAVDGADTYAAIEDGMKLGTLTSKKGVTDISITAANKLYDLVKALCGTAGGTAVTPVAAVNVTGTGTEAYLGKISGDVLKMNGSVRVSAATNANHQMKADATATGQGAAVGAGVAVSVVSDEANARLNQSLNARDVTVASDTVTSLNSWASATASGGRQEGKSADQQADGLVETAEELASKNKSDSVSKEKTGKAKSDSRQQAQTGEGTVGVAGSAAITVLNAETGASIADGGAVKVKGDMTVDAKELRSVHNVASAAVDKNGSAAANKNAGSEETKDAGGSSDAESVAGNTKETVKLTVGVGGTAQIDDATANRPRVYISLKDGYKMPDGSKVSYAYDDGSQDEKTGELTAKKDSDGRWYVDTDLKGLRDGILTSKLTLEVKPVAIDYTVPFPDVISMGGGEKVTVKAGDSEATGGSLTAHVGDKVEIKVEKKEGRKVSKMLYGFTDTDGVYKEIQLASGSETDTEITYTFDMPAASVSRFMAVFDSDSGDSSAKDGTGKSVGVGAAFSMVYGESKINAEVGKRGAVDAGTLTVTAASSHEEDIAGAAGTDPLLNETDPEKAKKTAGDASVALNILDNGIQAKVAGETALNVTTGDLTVTAKEESLTETTASAFSVGGKTAVGATAAVNVANSAVKAEMLADATVAGGATVSADSHSEDKTKAVATALGADIARNLQKLNQTTDNIENKANSLLDGSIVDQLNDCDAEENKTADKINQRLNEKKADQDDKKEDEKEEKQDEKKTDGKTDANRKNSLSSNVLRTQDVKAQGENAGSEGTQEAEKEIKDKTGQDVSASKEAGEKKWQVAAAVGVTVSDHAAETTVGKITAGKEIKVTAENTGNFNTLGTAAAMSRA